ncbi:hypothetical protein ASC97_15455 [Rhizobium sp. Root1203]|nr:hypothetical protein ASC97_15455 [Rhizobium sp. Root1203]
MGAYAASAGQRRAPERMNAIGRKEDRNSARARQRPAMALYEPMLPKPYPTMPKASRMGCNERAAAQGK